MLRVLKFCIWADYHLYRCISSADDAAVNAVFV